MKILFLVNRYPGIGGIENMTTLLAGLFKTNLGYETSIFSVQGQHGITVDSSLNVNDVEIANTKKKVLIIMKFETFLRKKSPDIVIFQDSYAEIEYLLNSIHKPTRIFTVEHNTPDCFLKTRINARKSSGWSISGIIYKLRFLDIYIRTWYANGMRHRKLVQVSDKYILLSESYKKTLKSLWRINNSKIIAIPNIKNDFGFVDTTSILSLQRKKQVLFVGRLDAQKGIKKLIEVWKILEQKVLDWELVIVGDGEERSLLEKEINKLQFKRVRLEGFRTDVADYYRESSAIFMTSIFEGFGLVLPEAMQFGVIPFAYDTFLSLHDIIEDKKDGFIIRAFDAEIYANTFCKFLSMSESEVEQLRKTAIESSLKFSKLCVLSKWKELFETTYESSICN